MTAQQVSKLGTAYKHAKTVLDQIEDGDDKHTIFTLSSAVGALEMLCLQANQAIHPSSRLSDEDRAQFVAAGRNR